MKAAGVLVVLSFLTFIVAFWNRNDLPANIDYVDAILEEHGRDGFAAAWLARRDLGWASELLGPSDAVIEATPSATLEANDDKEKTDVQDQDT